MLARLVGSLQLSSRAKLNPDDPFGNLPNELLSRIFVLCSDSPLRVFYRQHEIPNQLSISQVCSRWRQVALSTGVLWSNIKITEYDTKYAHRLRLYRMFVGRAGDHPLIVSLSFYGSLLDIYKVFLDFFVPFQIKGLGITTMPHHKLVDLPPLNVEEHAIVGTNRQTAKDLKVPPFVDKIRHICIWDSAIASGEWEPKLKELFLSCHQLRYFECHSAVVSLSTWLNILRHPGMLQYLERCHLTISNAGSGSLPVGVYMPNLCWLSLSLLDVQPDIVIPLIVAPNITTLEISFQDNWSSDTYDIMKRHYKLHQLHQVRFQGARFSLRFAQVLADAPMIHKLEGLGTPILDTEAREGIANGRLGRCLTTLRINGCIDNVGDWLDMIETRQRNVKSMVAQVSNWREMFTGIKLVEFWDAPHGNRDYKERVATLEALGTTVKFVP